MVHYKTGVCYLKSRKLTINQGDTLLEYALANGKVMPPSLYYDLGSIYPLKMRIFKKL
jgi:hypothetical protein